MTTRAQERGFSLIEAAIVLAIIGLVLGGIWVAAAQVQRSLYRDEIIRIIQEANQRFAATWKDMPFTNDGSNYEIITPSLYPASSLVAPSALGSPASSYFGGNVYRAPSGLVLELYADLTGGSDDVIHFVIGPLDGSDCAWFGRKFSSIVPNNGGTNGGGMGQVGVYNATNANPALNFGWDGNFNIGDDMIAYLVSSCETTRTNYINVSEGRP